MLAAQAVPPALKGTCAHLRSFCEMASFLHPSLLRKHSLLQLAFFSPCAAAADARIAAAARAAALVAAATRGDADEVASLLDSTAAAAAAAAEASGGDALAAGGAARRAACGAVEPSWRGDTAVHAAARNGHARVLSLLLDSGADPNAPDARGAPPLAAARAAEQCEAEAALLRAGATDPRRASEFAMRLPDDLGQPQQHQGAYRHNGSGGRGGGHGGGGSGPQERLQQRRQERAAAAAAASACDGGNNGASSAASHAHCWSASAVAGAGVAGALLGAAAAVALLSVRVRRSG